MTFLQRAVVGLLFCLILAVTADAQMQLHNPEFRSGYWKPESGLFDFLIPNSVAMKTPNKVKNQIAHWNDFNGLIDVDVFMTPDIKEDPLTAEFVGSIGEKRIFVKEEHKGTELMKPVFSKKGTPKLAEGCYSLQPVKGLIYYDIIVFAYYPKQQELYQFVIRIKKGEFRIPDAREHLRKIRFGPDVAPLPADVALDVPEPKPPEILKSDLTDWMSDDKRFAFQYPKNIGLKDVQIPVDRKRSLLAAMGTDKKDIQLSLVRVANVDTNNLNQEFFSKYRSDNFKSHGTLSMFLNKWVVICESRSIGEFDGLRKIVAFKAMVEKERATMYVLVVAYDEYDLAAATYAKRILQEGRLVNGIIPGTKLPEPGSPPPIVPPITPEPQEPTTPPTRVVPNPTTPKPEKPTSPTDVAPPTPATRTTFWTTRNTLLVAGGVLFGLVLVGIGAVLLGVMLKQGKSKPKYSPKKKRSERDD